LYSEAHPFSVGAMRAHAASDGAAMPLLQTDGAKGAVRFRRAVTQTTTARRAFTQPAETFTKEPKIVKKRTIRQKRAHHSKHSFVYKMLNPSSKSIQAVVYRNFTGSLIAINVACFILSSYSYLDSKYGDVFERIEASTSYAFLIDYFLRIATVIERKRWRTQGCCLGRLGWALSFDGVLDALATFPYFVDTFILKDILPSFTWVRIFRIFVLFRTNKYAHAMNTVSRVLFVNREILGVSLFLVLFMLLFTSAMIWAVADEACREANNIDSVPDAMYLALQMLTGQGAPEGDLTFAMMIACSITAFLSVPFFAVPAAMLTWGFEGEAERLAEKEARRFQRKRVYADHKSLEASMDTDSSSSSDSAMEEYLQRWGGEDEHEKIQTEALEFFEQAEKCDGEAIVSKALDKANELKKKSAAAQRNSTFCHDALLLLEQVDEDDLFLDGEDASKMAPRLLQFRDMVKEEAIKDAELEEEKEPSLNEVMAEVKAMRKDMEMLTAAMQKQQSWFPATS